MIQEIQVTFDDGSLAVISAEGLVSFDHEAMLTVEELDIVADLTEAVNHLNDNEDA